MAELTDGELVLEPSAGIGLLADGIKAAKKVDVHCVELNQKCRETLASKGYEIVGNDFFLFKSETKYDCVIAAPNFRDNVDCDHVMKMHTHLRPGGRLVSIMSPAWMTGESDRQVEFRSWLQGRSYRIGVLPDFSYIEDGKTVPTIIIRIES
jgi:16S rRNA G1207 methylase RsmC